MIEQNSNKMGRRHARAQETRRRILGSARRLFAERGYGAVTLELIADDADVAVQTIYAVYRNKVGLLFALVDGTRAETSGDAHREALDREPDPRRQVWLLASFAAEFFGTIHDIVDILRGAGSADPNAAAAWHAGEGRRREKDRAVVQGWSARGILRLPPQEAEDILWALTGPDVYRLLIEESGWPMDRYVAWLDRTIATQLLASE